MKKQHTITTTVFSTENPLAVERRKACFMSITHETGAKEGEALIFFNTMEGGQVRFRLTRDDFRALLKVATEATQHCWGLE